MQEFEVCFEDISKNEVYHTKFLGSGLRYEISEFVSRINGYERKINRLTDDESIAMAGVLQAFLDEQNR